MQIIFDILILAVKILSIKINLVIPDGKLRARHSPLRRCFILILRQKLRRFGTDVKGNHLRFTGGLFSGSRLFRICQTGHILLFQIGFNGFHAVDIVNINIGVNINCSQFVGVNRQRFLRLGNFKSLNGPAGNSPAGIIVIYRRIGNAAFPNLFRVGIIAFQVLN